MSADRTLADFIRRLSQGTSRSGGDTPDQDNITERVIRELRGMGHISEADIGWIVEATLFQLQWLARRSGIVDLDYLGDVRRQENVHCGDGVARTTCTLVWNLPIVDVQHYSNGDDHA